MRPSNFRKKGFRGDKGFKKPGFRRREGGGGSGAGEFRKDMHPDRRRLFAHLREKVTASMRSEDHIIVESVYTVEAMDKVINLLYERLEVWARIFHPELRYASVDQLVSGILQYPDNPLPVKLTVDEILGLQKTREIIWEDAKSKVKTLCPNMTYLVGEEVTARILSSAGSLQRLAGFPSSTIQVLGAEKALFKHLRSGTNPPKHGVIFLHPEINRAPKKVRGKIARAIAAKLTIASKADAITKNFIADKLKEQMDKQIRRVMKKTR